MPNTWAASRGGKSLDSGIACASLSPDLVCVKAFLDVRGFSAGAAKPGEIDRIKPDTLRINMGEG
jgi:hypothetical protein